MTEPEPLEFIGANEVCFQNRTLVYFSGCDFFRLARDLRLEKSLAKIFDAESALVLPDGYLAPLAVASALAGDFSHALIDESAHGALSDAARLLACPVKKFRHRQVADLEKVLSSCGRNVRPIVLTDGVFSQDGAVAPLRDCLKNLPRGGVVLSSASLRKKIIQRSRAFAGTTTLLPPLAGAALAAVKILAAEPERRKKLFQNVASVRKQLRAVGWEISETPGAIVCLPQLSEKWERELKKQLFAAGIYPPYLRYGNVAHGTFRFIISSEHTAGQLEKLCAVLAAFKKKNFPTMKSLSKPERLNVGDTIGLVAPASAPPDSQAIDRAVNALESYGFKVKLAKNVRARLGFIAGTDRARAEDLMAMFTDKKVKAIHCLRGGYGVTRLLGRLDFSVIARNPKIFSGYSDITALHLAIQKFSKFISFHAPMVNGALAAPDVPEFTKKSFFRTVMEAKPPGSLRDGCPENKIEILRRGTAVGELIGGNLSLLCASLGTSFAPSLKGKIIFFEEVSELPFRLDRMLTQLLNAGILQQVAGVAVGVNVGCTDPIAKADGEYRQSSADVMKERLSSLRVPIVTGLPFGHVDLNATIPCGARVLLDGNKGDLIVTEAVVK